MVVPDHAYLRKLGLFPVSRQRYFMQVLRDQGVKVRDQIPENTHVVITTDFVKKPSRFEGRPLVLVNHGSGFKSVMYRMLRRQRDIPYHIMVEGPFRKEHIQKIVGEGAYQIPTVGYIKLDPYPGLLKKRETWIRSWGLDPSKPTLLYAPTYKPTSIFQLGERLLDVTRSFNLLIKLHPYSWEGKYAPTDTTVFMKNASIVIPMPGWFLQTFKIFYRFL